MWHESKFPPIMYMEHATFNRVGVMECSWYVKQELDQTFGQRATPDID